MPQPATVDNLMLTALGGWLDCDAHWDLPASSKSKHFNSSLLSWRHRAVQGRDTYVRVVRKGYLFPWGHKASLITVTDREFSQQGPNGPVGAYLRQKTFIVVTQPVKTYGGADKFVTHGGRRIPFISVEALTLVTPDLEPPAKYIIRQVRQRAEEGHSRSRTTPRRSSSRRCPTGRSCSTSAAPTGPAIRSTSARTCSGWTTPLRTGRTAARA